MKIDLLKNHTQFIDELNQLYFDQWHHLRPELNIEQWKELLISRANDKIIPTILIALENNNLMGAAALVENDMKTRPDLTPWLAAVYVKKEYRRQGVAGKLASAIESSAKELGKKEIFLYTADQEKLYKNLGWSTIERTIYKNQDVAVMRKDML